MPIPLLIFLIFLVLVILRYIFWPNLNDTSKATIESNKFVMDTDGTRVLVNSGTIYQFMESLQLIENTSNIDTLKSRIDFTKKLFKRIKIAYMNDQRGYMAASSKAKSMIKRAYPKYYSSYDMNSLMNQDETYLSYFYSENVVRCFEEYKEKMILEISKLKTTPAKQKRIENVKSCYKTCCETLSFDECNIHMENLKELYEIFLLIYEESN